MKGLKVFGWILWIGSLIVWLGSHVYLLANEEAQMMMAGHAWTNIIAFIVYLVGVFLVMKK